MIKSFNFFETQEIKQVFLGILRKKNIRFIEEQVDTFILSKIHFLQRNSSQKKITIETIKSYWPLHFEKEYNIDKDKYQ